MESRVGGAASIRLGPGLRHSQLPVHRKGNPLIRSILLRAALVLLPLFISPTAAMGDSGAVSMRVQVEQTAGSQGAGGGEAPAQAAPPRSMRAYWHVFIAFGITWALIFAFALSIGRRFGQLELEVQRLTGR